ncbi:MAG: AMP-binding protein [Sphingobacteriales bacterium]|jgi:long-chain acyl-CoA synthetase|nr:AMP-binding protein [Sphingobacteriales bacterium]MBP9140312.1 AMP-binding protein [Chitinophagales bacterium]MDA0197161.1 AMP-binding protein [Bacteroidota bacterium]MBK6891406.1 AMP-binding protein [Sphingobacteriales bacterium]MBK7526762.1 AMP-binding protein [Sphingobacteriales bacterium]
METNTILSPLDMLMLHERQRGQQLFLNQPLESGKILSFTWSEAGHQARCMASALRAMGYPAQSRIAILSKNCAHWIIADLAIMMAGYVSVPIYPTSTADSITYVLQHCNARAIFVGKLDDFSKQRSAITPDTNIISFAHYGPNEPGLLNWEDLTNTNDPLPVVPELNLDTMATIIYTSGTTGTPKGVVHSFRALAWALTKALEVIELGKDGRFFSYLPLAHIAERMLVEYGSIYTGNAIYFAQSLDTFANDLQKASPTIFLGVPRIWTKFQMGILNKLPQKKLSFLLGLPIVGNLIRNKLKKALGLNKTEICLSGAAPISPSIILWFEKIGIRICEVYGLTENAAYSHFNLINQRKVGSVGVALPEVSIKIDLETSELLMKSSALMLEYYLEPELTHQTIDTDGWLHTGDMAKLDEDGFLHIIGRVKELFKTEKGKYIAPSPLEILLMQNTLIEQCCVVGAGYPQPIALLVLSGSAQHQAKETLTQSLAETLTNLNNKLEAHQRIKKMVVITQPWTTDNGLLTPTLKVKRAQIEAKYQNYYDNWYKNIAEIIWT